MEKFNLIAGLPRSGSTLLCNLLNMNPRFHATPTSYTIDIIRNIRSTFSHNVTAKTHDRLGEMDAIRNGMKGFLDGFYADKEVVFDKSRGWTSQLGLLDEILGHRQTKIIWTYRNPVEVVSSIEKRYQDTLLLENGDEAGGGNFTTLSNRVDAFINDGSIVAQPVWLLDDAVNRMGLGDRIMIVKYWDLTNNTQETLNRIHHFIGEEPFEYDKNNFTDLKQSTFEFDGMYNYKFMHTIKEGGVQYKKHDVTLPEDLVEKINHRFSWLNEYVSTH
jgi:sulfotransferase